MNVIKVNYNNAAIKKPRKITPDFFIYREVEEVDGVTHQYLIIKIDNKLNEEPYYVDYEFIVYVDQNVVAYVTPETGNIIKLDNPDVYRKYKFVIDIEGYYESAEGLKYKFVRQPKTYYYTYFCSEEIKCSEEAQVNDCTFGYFNPDDKLFYEHRELVEDEYVYTDLIVDYNIRRYVDTPTELIYKYNETDEIFELI